MSPLVGCGRFDYEDVCNSTYSSTKWMCNSKGYLDRKTGTFKQCLCNKYKTFWNDYGDFFGGDSYKHTKEIEFIHGKNCWAAFNSSAKQSEIEIYGAGLKKTIYLHPILCLWFLKPVITFNYFGDNIGNITGRRWKIHFLKKSNLFGKNTYCIYYTSGIWMLYRLLRSFYKKIIYYKSKQPVSNYGINDLYREFDNGKYFNDRWWEVMYFWYINTFYSKLKKEIIKKHLEIKK
jgi:hypothetical protein